MTRVRLRFTKTGKVRWTSHRDVARMWERALRRAEVPVAYTEGFSPRPRLSFGLALSTGHESLGEYVDVELAAVPAELVAGLPGLLSPALPMGIDCVAGLELDGHEPSLQQDVTACSWEIELAGVSVAGAEAAVAAALGVSSLVATRTRKGHEVTDDLRPAIVALAVAGQVGDGVVITAEVATQPRGLRPGELVDACFGGAEARRVLRTHQWIERDGARREPVPVDARSLPHALRACA